MNFGTIQVADIFVGALNATEAYFGTEKVWGQSAPPTEGWTKVKYTAASGLPDWEGDIVGKLSGTSSSPYYTTQIPNVLSAETIEIGSHVTEIGLRTFWKCQNITSITIPTSVTIMSEEYIFYLCSGLSSVIIPNGVTSIGNGMFYSSGITSMTFPDSVTYIGNNTFRNCANLVSVFIPHSVNIIQADVFKDCPNLVNLTVDKPQSDVRGMLIGYGNWGLPTGSVIHCSDGDITL